MSTKTKQTYVPEWTPEEMSLVRRMARAGASQDAVRDALKTPLSAEAVSTRARKIGVVLVGKKGKAHQGTSTNYLPPGTMVRLERSEAAFSRKQRA